MEFEGFGVEFEARRKIFDENLALLKKRWRGATAGPGCADAINVAPVQDPMPPIYVATMHQEGAHAVGLTGDSMLTLVPPATEGSWKARRKMKYARCWVSPIIVTLVMLIGTLAAPESVVCPAVPR